MTERRTPIRLRPGVTLGPIPRDSAERMLRWVSDPVVSGNLGLRDAPSLGKTLAWIAKAAADDSMRPFAVLLEGRHVGNVILDLIDQRLQKARFSIYLGEPDARAGGVGVTSTYLALKAAFEEIGLYKVWLTVHAQNARAIQTYLNAGFRKEGLLRGEFLLNGMRLDAWYMGILAEEFSGLPLEPMR
jgi:diamine N-acetyltransferase